MRRRYFTHPRFQFLFTSAFVLGSLLVIALLGAQALGVLCLLVKCRALNANQLIQINESLRHLAGILFWSTTASVVIFGVLGAYLSYKFVGPLARLENWIELQLIGQKPTPLKLRSGDELEKINDTLNRLMSTATVRRKEE